MELNLKDKVALVTGGSRGIGTAICYGLAREGVHVGVNYNRSAEKAKTVAGELNTSYGVKSIALVGNMAEEGAILAMLDKLERELGNIDILVNNAAYCPSGPTTSYSTDEWEKTFAVNVTGAFVASREVVRRWLERDVHGTIVNVASQAAFLGSTTGHLPYDSSKGALVSMTRGIAREVAKQGIRVNAVAPGMVMTEMVAETWEKRKDRYLSRIPMYRIAQPEEIANVVVFLASAAASYMTGTTLDLTGGMLMR